MEEQNINIENRTSRVRKRAEKKDMLEVER